MKVSALSQILPCLFLLSLPGLAMAEERAASLVNSFQVMCTLEPLDFARIDAKATTMQLKVFQDTNVPKNDKGYYLHQKGWTLPLTTGPHALIAADAYGNKGHVKSCGIADDNMENTAFRTELVKVLQLGKPGKDTIADDGKHVMEWPYASGMYLVLAEGTKQKDTGVLLMLLDRTQ